MKQKKKILSPYKRKVHIEEQEWSYRIISSYSLKKDQVKVCSPDRTKKWNLDVRNLGNTYLDTSCTDCEGEDCENCSPDSMNAMTPAHVKRLIEKRILGRVISR